MLSTARKPPHPFLQRGSLRPAGTGDGAGVPTWMFSFGTFGREIWRCTSDVGLDLGEYAAGAQLLFARKVTPETRILDKV